MDITIEALISICTQHILAPENGVIIPEPYIPFILSNWNKTIGKDPK
ncbi:MAG: hypothetical protein WAV76_16405 [Bacteroidota bacterium]